jgi:type IV pilus assembly protein PilC
MNQTLGPISAIGLLFIGIGLLWAVRLAYRGRRRMADDSFRLLLVITGWLLIQMGAIGGIAQALFFSDEERSGLGVAIASLIGASISLIVSATLVSRYRAMEWRSLMWTLAAAAYRGVPLPEAIRGFASERTDEIGLRAHQLAELVEAGYPLPEAFDMAACRLPPEGLLAIRFGTETGQLSQTISKLTARDPRAGELLRQTFERFFYLGIVAFVVSIVSIYMMLRIVPTFAKMMDEFETEVPWVTQLLFTFSTNQLPWLGLLFVVLFIVGSVGVFWSLLFNWGLLERAIPGVQWLIRRMDNALVMRALAVAVADQRPLPEAVELLSRVHPKRSMRARLLRALQGMARGQQWTESLQRMRLLRPAESALFEAAERAGNLAWALEEMADSSVRRALYRLRVVVNILFPCGLLVLGVFVGMLVIGLFLPLISLIQGLIPS